MARNRRAGLCSIHALTIFLIISLSSARISHRNPPSPKLRKPVSISSQEPSLRLRGGSWNPGSETALSVDDEDEGLPLKLPEVSPIIVATWFPR